MGVRESIARALFGDIIQQAVNEAVAESDRGWTSLSPLGIRDVPFSEHRDHIADSLEAYRTNPLAFRIVELTTDFVLGSGMRLETDDPNLQAFLTDWWSHPLNNLSLRQYDLCTELTLAGELFLTFHTNPFDGMSYIRLIPAGHVDEIETNPNDIEDELRYHVTAWTNTTFDGIRFADKPTALEGRWWTKDECRHYAINRPIGTVRGQGDLVPELPWLRRYKDWLTDRARINKFKGAFLWDVTLKGATKQAVLARQSELASPPPPGSVLVHNESEEWKACQPIIDAQAVEPDGKALRLMVAAGAGVPLHYLAEGEGATRATAAEMGTPTYRHYQRRQLTFGQIMADIAATAARRSGKFSQPFAPIRPHFQDVSPLEANRLATATAAIANALAAAVDVGIIDQATAQRFMADYLADYAAQEAPTSMGSFRKPRRTAPKTTERRPN